MDKNNRLEDVLALYGANSLRWPVEERDDLLSFIAEDKQANERFESAKALDQCLQASMVTCSAAEEKNLSANIMMRIKALEPSQESSSKEGGGSFKKMEFLKKVSRPEGRFAEFSLLAASLVLGVFIGLALVSGSYLEQEFQLAFLDNGIVLEQSLEDILLGAEIL